MHFKRTNGIGVAHSSDRGPWPVLQSLTVDATSSDVSQDLHDANRKLSQLEKQLAIDETTAVKSGQRMPIEAVERKIYDIPAAQAERDALRVSLVS
eukprot:SAG31_NODE_1851_length_7077_cov_2.680854_4_plen_96_part_00